MDDLGDGVVNLAALLGVDRWSGFTPKERLQEELISSLRKEVKQLEEEVRRLKGQTSDS